MTLERQSNFEAKELGGDLSPGFSRRREIPQSGSLEMAPRIDLLALLLDIVRDGRRTDHCRNRVARARLHGAGHQTAERKRHLGRESKA